MIGYVTLGTNDLQRAAAFYDALLTEIGAARLWDIGHGIAWGTAMDKPCLAILQPFNKEPASVGNGTMVALAANSKETVDRLHAKALALGAKDEGPAGPRGDSFYAGYFRDLEGNKFSVFCTQ
ncbi:VOC family protein [Rhodoferax aquaticus]|uniref:VOC family protein n=1 Tax=Rhodoferax aquaticus TaxID=2527691 RepID=A0A515EQM5_9BURK|nr:VOC family protein [Rhodoferax aquaticus]QDL54956.1 VOC family protein [Rhodoferax aquaticus]